VGSSGDKRAEAAIGTSIIFIAMILTSSAAGSMVLGNMDAASQQAQDAFDGSLDMTADHFEIRSATGVCDPSRAELVGLELLVTLGPGSGDLNLSSVVIELTLEDAHLFLTIGDGMEVERVLSGGRSNSTSVIALGDLYTLSFALPHNVGPNEVVKVSLLPAKGFTTSTSFTVPDTITSHYISLR
jgi:flagellin-like protein